MKNINKKYAIIAVLVLLIGAVAAMQLTKKDSSTTTKSSAGKSASTKSSNGNVFSPLATSGSSYSATITSTASGNETTAKMEFDKTSGNTRYTSSAGGQNLTIVYTKDTYYLCQTADSCIKYPLTGSTPSFDPSSYQYTSAQLAGYSASANYQGKQSCPAGTCDVWKVSNSGYTSSLFIDTKTKRISQVEGTTAAGSSKIVYDYQDVTVAVPANATSLPTYP